MAIETQKFFNEAIQVNKETRDKEEEISEANKRLAEPFGNADLAAPGPVEVKSDDDFYNVNFATETVDEEIKKKILELFGSLEWNPISKNKNNVDHWVYTKRLVFKMSGTEIDTARFLPAGSRIFFLPSAEIFKGCIVHNGESKDIFLFGDPFSPRNLLTLAHELGHHQYDLKKQAGKFDELTGLDPDIAEILRSEREASLFALRRLWVALKKRPELKKDAITFLRDFAYKSYCSGGLVLYWQRRPGFDSFATGNDEYWDNWWADQEEENWHEENLTMFKRFQNSEFYDDWKNSGKNKNLVEEDDLLDSFLEWIDENETNQDFWKKYGSIFNLEP